MEIKDRIFKPCKDEEKADFIVINNHQKGYEIRETDETIEAWGYSENELLKQLKKEKYAEACAKAYSYLNEGKGLFEFENGKHIEATGDNFAKLTPYMLELAMEEIMDGGQDKILEKVMNLLSGKIIGKTVQWTTKEDEIVNLNVIQIVKILKGIGRIQSHVWGEKFLEYKSQIENAQTIEDVNAIEINYGGEDDTNI